MAYQMNQLREKVMKGGLPQEVIRGNTPLCSGLYKYMFNACRVPMPDGDVVAMYDQSQYSHIIVMHDNNIYSLDVKDLSVA